MHNEGKAIIQTGILKHDFSEHHLCMMMFGACMSAGVFLGLAKSIEMPLMALVNMYDVLFFTLLILIHSFFKLWTYAKSFRRWAAFLRRYCVRPFSSIEHNALVIESCC